MATLQTRAVAISRLRPYPGNPRRGNLAAIRESLEANGQYRPIVVNRPTMEVLGEGARQAVVSAKAGADRRRGASACSSSIQLVDECVQHRRPPGTGIVAETKRGRRSAVPVRPSQSSRSGPRSAAGARPAKLPRR